MANARLGGPFLNRGQNSPRRPILASEYVKVRVRPRLRHPFVVETISAGPGPGFSLAQGVLLVDDLGIDFLTAQQLRDKRPVQPGCEGVMLPAEVHDVLSIDGGTAKEQQKVGGGASIQVGPQAESRIRRARCCPERCPSAAPRRPLPA